MEISVTRICKYCKIKVNLETEQFVYNKKRYYHFNCAVNEQLDRKNNKLSQKECIEKFTGSKENYYNYMDNPYHIQAYFSCLIKSEKSKEKQESRTNSR